MTSSRLAILGTILGLLLPATLAAAEPATVASTVNLRSGAGTGTSIVGKIPGGSRIEASNCSEWCEVEWQGKKGFVIAASLDRAGRAAPPHARKRSDPFATDIAANKSVLDTPRSTYEAPQRYYGPVFWTHGPATGAYKGATGIGYRGRW
jgi:uncharacterized protein YraI